MGTWWSSHHAPQTKEMRVVYAQDDKGHVYPIRWPDHYFDFLIEIRRLFPHLKNEPYIHCIFEDAGSFDVHIVSEATYQALVPKYKKISDTACLYYVSLKYCIAPQKKAAKCHSTSHIPKTRRRG